MFANELFTKELARHLLSVDRPAIIDGNMDLQNWFIPRNDFNAPKKVGFSERDFSHLDLYCYDPIFDLANLAASRPMDGFSEALRNVYQESIKQEITPERWLLYQWVHLWNKHRLSSNEIPFTQRSMARVFQRYFSELFFEDLEIPRSGWLCAIDIDGVLETHPFGFPQLTPSSALALRALISHGFQPLIVTGRSLDEVSERCQSYHLAGGVAEYGSAFHNHLSGEDHILLTSEEREMVNGFQEIIGSYDGIKIDPDYKFIIRAYKEDGNKQRVGLSPEVIENLFPNKQTLSAFRMIRGKAQTDFVIKRIDKRTGLMSLIEELKPERAATEKPLVFSVGDTSSDLPMFELAARSFVPAHSTLPNRFHSFKRMSKPYQAGLSQAVTRVLHHRPGGCSLCSWDKEAFERSLLLDIMAAQEGSRIDMLKRAASLAIRVRRIE